MIYVLIVATCILIFAVIWLGITCRDLLKDEQKRNEGLCHKCANCVLYDGVRIYCEKVRGLCTDTFMLGEALACKQYKENSDGGL